MDAATSHKLLGVPEGSIRGKTDLEKVRQRSKELYKRYVSEKEEKKAKRVLEAFEVIKTRYKKQNGATPAGGAAPTSTSAAKPEAHPAASARRSATAGGAAAVQSAVERDLAKLRRQFGDTSGDAGKSTDGDSKKPERSVSSQVRKPEKPTVVKVRSSNDVRSGTTSTIRGSGTLTSSKGVLTLGLPPKKPDPAVSSNGRPKRPSSQDIYGNAALAAKRGRVVAAQPAQNGVDKQAARLICKCGASYGAQRMAGAVGSFVCPGCRVRSMDPLNVVLKGSKGMLNLKLVQKPLVPEDAKLEARFKFRLDVSEIKEWRKLGHNVEARMCRLDCYDAHQSWPNSMAFKVNGKPAFTIKEPKPGHKRRDLPHRISANLKPGVNSFEVRLKDTDVQRYALAVVRTSPLIPKDMCKHVPIQTEEDCRQRVLDLLFSSMLEGCVEDFAAAASDRSRLTCPITLARMRTPARGKKCKHLQCFDLEAYLLSNQRMAVINKRWHCPVCDLILKPPGDLFIDTFIVKILAETGECDEEVGFDNTGNWTVTAVAPSPASDSEEGEPWVAAPPQEGGDIDDGSSDVAVAEEQPGSDHSDAEAVDIAEDNDVDDGDAANAEDDNVNDEDAADKDPDLSPSDDKVNDEDAEDKDVSEDVELDDQTNASPKVGGPAGSPSASPDANWGSGSPDPDSDGDDAPDCQTDPYGAVESDPYMMSMKDDDDVDEDFVATLRDTPKDDADGDLSVKSSAGRSHALKLMSMIATPAPLASPTPGMPGSPGEASDKEDPDDPLGLEKVMSPKKVRSDETGRKRKPMCSLEVLDDDL